MTQSEELESMKALEAIIDDMLDRYDELSPAARVRLDELLDYVNSNGETSLREMLETEATALRGGR